MRLRKTSSRVSELGDHRQQRRHLRGPDLEERPHEFFQADLFRLVLGERVPAAAIGDAQQGNERAGVTGTAMRVRDEPGRLVL
jgi:hypothetical protein